MKKSFRNSSIIFFFLLTALILSGCKNESEKLLDKGNKKFVKGDLTGALKIYKELLQKDSGNIAARLRLATTSVCISSDAGGFLKEMITIGKADSNIRKMMYAKEWFDKIKSGIRNENAMREERKKIGTHVLNISDEISLLTEAIENNPNRKQLYLGRGIWYYNIKNMDNAIEDFSKAIELDRNYAEAYSMRGLCYLDARAYKLFTEETRNFYYAWFDFNYAVHVSPKNIMALNNLALSYLNLHQFENVVKISTEIISIDSLFINAYQLRAFAYQELKKLNEAEKDYSILAKHFPQNPMYLYFLANRQLDRGELKEALYNLHKAESYILGDDPLKYSIQATIKRLKNIKK